MTSTHDISQTLEILNDLYLIVSATDLSNSRISKADIHEYLDNQIELALDQAEREMDEWESRD
jgi:hypothetical protein